MVDVGDADVAVGDEVVLIGRQGEHLDSRRGLGFAAGHDRVRDRVRHQQSSATGSAFLPHSLASSRVMLLRVDDLTGTHAVAAAIAGARAGRRRDRAGRRDGRRQDRVRAGFRACARRHRADHLADVHARPQLSAVAPAHAAPRRHLPARAHERHRRPRRCPSWRRSTGSCSSSGATSPARRWAIISRCASTTSTSDDDDDDARTRPSTPSTAVDVGDDFADAGAVRSNCARSDRRGPGAGTGSPASGAFRC